MLVAGVITSLGCALIIAPIALCHRIRQMGRVKQDIIDFHARRAALVREREEAVAALGIVHRHHHTQN